MARLFLKRTLSGFSPADEWSSELWKKFKLNEVYRADVVRPRNYQAHKLCFALLNVTFSNQEQYSNFDDFRKAVTLAAGHSKELTTLDGEILRYAGSLSYEELDETAFQQLFPKMMAVCCHILKDVDEHDLEAEVSKYAGTHYGMMD